MCGDTPKNWGSFFARNIPQKTRTLSFQKSQTARPTNQTHIFGNISKILNFYAKLNILKKLGHGNAFYV